MTTQTKRARWTTYNTWHRDRRKAKRSSRKARDELTRLINQAPAALAAAQKRNTTMTSRQDDTYWTEEAMEARQEARRRAILRCGNPKPRQPAPKPPTERQRLLAAGLVFTVAEQDRESSDAEHRARRRRAEQEVTQRENLHAKLRDWYGPDYADEYLR